MEGRVLVVREVRVSVCHRRGCPSCQKGEGSVYHRRGCPSCQKGKGLCMS